MSIKAPCHECKDRRIGCHGECEKYISFSRENKELRERIKTENELFSYKQTENDKKLHRKFRKVNSRYRGYR